MTVTQAAAGHSTLVALVIAVACGGVVLVPSLVLLYALFLRGRLDTPESRDAEGPATPAPALAPPRSSTSAVRALTRMRAWVAAAAAGLVAGFGLLVFANAAWAHALGVLGLVLCAVSVFALAAPGQE
jgi:cytochrome d ubiquinol oxidase subunit II